jgi:hypothetical protein
MVNDTIETAAFTAPAGPSGRSWEAVAKVLMSCWMRWSGLSTGVVVNCAR